MNKAIFLDRDGTINVDTGFVHKIHKFEKGAVKGLKLLQNLNCKLIIVTGQSGIARGYYTEQDYHKFMKNMYSDFKKYKIKIEKDYFCPHHPKEGIGKYKINCDCRKPKIGMVKKASKDFNIDLSKSWVIGDKTDDIKMGENAGCKTILLKTGYAGKDGHFKVIPNYTAENLYKAAQIILENDKS